MMKNPKTTIQILAVMLIVTMVAFIRSAYQNRKLQADLDRQTENVGSLTYDIQYGNLDDSLSVAKNTALQAKCDELKQLHLADTKLIEELKVKLKDVKSIHTASSSTADTVRIEPVPNTADSVFSYQDKWLSLHIDIPARLCQYISRDSLITIVSRTYKHKFLWWRWGTKGYQVQIVNFNPHSRINYSRYVEVVK
jgi:hypothetical protein